MYKVLFDFFMARDAKLIQDDPAHEDHGSERDDNNGEEYIPCEGMVNPVTIASISIHRPIGCALKYHLSRLETVDV